VKKCRSLQPFLDPLLPQLLDPFLPQLLGPFLPQLLDPLLPQLLDSLLPQLLISTAPLDRMPVVMRLTPLLRLITTRYIYEPCAYLIALTPPIRVRTRLGALLFAKDFLPPNYQLTTETLHILNLLILPI
jgi:hypothetical protein